MLRLVPSSRSFRSGASPMSRPHSVATSIRCFLGGRRRPYGAAVALLGVALFSVAPVSAAWLQTTEAPAAAPASVEAVDESNREQIEELIENLGVNEPDRREQAVRALIELGKAAIPILSENERHPSLEVRLRIVEVISEIRQNDVSRRLALLMSGEVDPETLQLPGWSQWIESVGDERNARSLYVELAKTEWELLEFADKVDEAELSQRLSELFKGYNQGGLTMNVPAYASCLFLATRLSKLDGQTMSGLSNFSRQDPIRLVIAQGRYSAPLKALLDRVILKMDFAYASLALQLAIDHSLGNGRVLALQLIDRAGEMREHLLRPAVITLVRLGTIEDLPVIETLFEDRRVIPVFLNNQQREAQLRDFALASAVMLSDKRLEDYGIQTFPPAIERSAWTTGVSVGFEDEAARDAAFAKWKAEREAEKE